jgi:hypothetical protein
MTDNLLSGVTLPLIDEDLSNEEAFRLGELAASPAVVSMKDGEFWLYYLSELEQAAQNQPTTAVNALPGVRLPALAQEQRQQIGLDLTNVDILDLGGLFENDEAARVGVLVTSVVNDFQGSRSVIALASDKGLFRLVKKAWYCPDDNEPFSAPGVCPTHKKALKRKT